MISLKPFLASSTLPCGLVAASLLTVPPATLSAAHAEAATARAWSTCQGVGAGVPLSATTVVSGIRVNRCMAPALARMTRAAAARGVWLSGEGWRDVRRQIALRKAHCGGHDYRTVYLKPAGRCSPATARPGRSMHERGLAVDFKVGGAGINRGSRTYRWLSAHAASYGFYNLTGEPWHWSVTGG